MLRLALLTLLVAPVAAAAPLHADLRVAEAPALRGEVEAWAATGVLDLAPALRDGAGLRILADGAEGTRAWVETTRAEPLGTFETDDENESFAWGAGALEALRCGPDCVAVLVAEGAGRVGVTGEGALRVGWTREPAAYCALASCRNVPPARAVPVPAGTLVARTGEGPGALPEGRPAASGDVLLILRDAAAEWAAADGRRVRVDALHRTEPLVGDASRTTQAFVVARLRGVAVEADPGAPAALHAAALSLRVRGAFSSPSVEGVVTFEGNETRLDGEPFDAAGDLAFEARALAATPIVAEDDSRTRGELSGDASSLRAGARVAQAPPRAAAPLGVAAGLAGLAVLAWLAARAALPLYSRIPRARVLANPNRARIYARLLERPGETVPDLVRATGLAPVVVRHHLRILERHALVTRRADGRRRRYHRLDAAPSPQDVLRRSVLADATRRAVAEALAASPEGATQRDLVERLGLSQRLVSYHLARLEEAGLAWGAEGTPRRYAASDVARALLAGDAPRDAS